MASQRGQTGRPSAAERPGHEQAPPGSSVATSSRLDFYKALSDFRGMFPSMTDDVIEAVLRANDGMVEATIDQLLAMSIDASPPPTTTTNGPSKAVASHQARTHQPLHGRIDDSVAEDDGRSTWGSTLASEDDGRSAWGSTGQRLQHGLAAAGSHRVATFPATSALLLLDTNDLSSLAQSLPGSGAQPTAAVAAAAASPTGPQHGLVTGQLSLHQQFEDPFADLCPISNQLKIAALPLLRCVIADQQQPSQSPASAAPVASSSEPEGQGKYSDSEGSEAVMSAVSSHDGLLVSPASAAAVAPSDGCDSSVPPLLPRPPKASGLSPSPLPPDAWLALDEGRPVRGDSPVSPPAHSLETTRTTDRRCLTLPVTLPNATYPSSHSPHSVIDISPSDIAELLANDDVPPSLPPPRRRSSRRKDQPSQEDSKTSHLRASAVRWGVPLVGKLPADFLRLIDDETPPPRPPKPHSKLAQVGLDEQRHNAHHERSLKLVKSRSERNAHIIAKLVADRDNAAATAAKAQSGHAAHEHRRNIPGTGHRNTNPSGEEPQSGRHARHRGRLPGERLSTNVMKMRIAENERRIKETCDLEDLDEETVRYLEDERLALIMQNEEFLREVKRNEDFMRTLEFEQELLEARLVVDRNRRLAAQSRARTADAFARRPSEIDASTATHLELPESEAAHVAVSARGPELRPSVDVDIWPASRAVPEQLLHTAVSATDSTQGSSTQGSNSMPQGGGSVPHVGTAPHGLSHGSGSSVHNANATAVHSSSSSSAGGSSSTITSLEIAGSTRAEATDSADFRRQLQGMGASSKKKFAVLAKNFFTRKMKRSHHAHATIGLSRTPLGPSTMNLLDDCDDEDLELDEDNEASSVSSVVPRSAYND